MPFVVKGAQAGFVQNDGEYLMIKGSKRHHRLHLKLPVH